MVKYSRRKDARSGDGEISRRPNADNQLVKDKERLAEDSEFSHDMLIEVKRKKELSHGSDETVIRIASKIKKRKKKVTSRYRQRGKHQVSVAALLQENSSRSKADTKEIYGYRFTEEEDAILKDAVLRYIKGKKWEEEEGLERLWNSRKYAEAYGCWSEIKMSLPHRPCTSIRRRAIILFDKGSFLGRWSKGETELLTCLHKKHGNKWKYLSTLIGRSRISIKEKWRCLAGAKPTGVWTRDEMQQLSDLVHTCLRVKLLEDKSSRQLLRDNISWDKIADGIGTHSHANCCNKWYGNLSAALVTDGQWATKDDVLLLERPNC